jgi:5'-nucleotidase
VPVPAPGIMSSIFGTSTPQQPVPAPEPVAPAVPVPAPGIMSSIFGTSTPQQPVPAPEPVAPAVPVPVTTQPTVTDEDSLEPLTSSQPNIITKSKSC